MSRHRETREQRIARVGALLICRRELIGLGEFAPKTFECFVVREGLVQVARGVYLRREAWQVLYPEERLLAATLAQARLNARRDWVFTHESAAAIWGLPLWGLRSARVHIATSPARPGRSSARVRRHLCEFADDEVVELAGLRVTSLTRTVVDLARSAPPELALGAADAGLRELLGPASARSLIGAAEWRAQQLEALGRNGRKGGRRARSLLLMADPRADSVAESVSRLQLARLGVECEIQVEIRGLDGRTYYADFEFVGQGIFGEVDGRAKYLDEEMRGGRTAQEVVLGEKDREDEIRGTTQKRIVRWGPKHIGDTRRLGERLRGLGVRVPRLE